LRAVPLEPTATVVVVCRDARPRRRAAVGRRSRV